MRPRSPKIAVSIELANDRQRTRTMMRGTVLPLAILLAGHAMADIMLQPGYQHVASALPPHLKHLQQPMVQAPAALPRAPLDNTLDPGYHLELHPVYTDAYHIPAEAITPWLQPQYSMPGLSKADYKRLTAGKALPGVAGIPMPTYQPYLPLPVHNRRKRSTGGDESAVSNQRDKRDKDDVASKSSLERDALPVNDLPNQDEEKRVKTRQSTGTLLSINPSDMYPMYQQYRAVEMDPVQANQQQAANQQASQMNQRATHVAVPRMALDNSQPAMIVQQPTEYRNAPDPRPSTFRVSLLPDPKRHADHVTIHDKDYVGATHDKVPVKQHVHQHMIIKNPQGSVTTGNYVSANPNGQSSVEQPVTQQTGQQVMQLYQDPNCASAIQYVLAPQTCGSYMDNYVWAYPAAPSYTPMQICMQNADSFTPTIYQLV